MSDLYVGPDPDLVQMLDDFLSTASTPQLAESTEVSGRADERLWRSAADLGLDTIGIPEESGGAGGTLHEAIAVAVASGRYAVPLPLVETHLAGWALTTVGDAPPRIATVVPGSSRDTLALVEGRLSGTAHRVPWARVADRVVAVLPTPSDGPVLVSFSSADATITPGQDLSGMPSDTVEVMGLGVVARPWPLGGNALGLRGALFRSAQIAGALTGLEEMTRRYVGERVQFGKPIGTFQAVQQHTVLLAQCAELTSVAVWQAAEAALSRPASFEIAAARLVAGESARLAVRAAHQAHGAIGVTREYPLHLLTRRLNTWQHEFGTERSARLALGEAAAASSKGFRHILFDHDNALEVPWRTT